MDKSVGVGTVGLVNQLSLTFNELEYVAYQHRHSNMKLINYNKSVWLVEKICQIWFGFHRTRDDFEPNPNK
jgi:hypothetical protein